MTAHEPPSLLIREQEELDRIAMALQGGRRMVVFMVCKEGLRDIVISYLNSNALIRLSKPAPIDEPEQMLSTLSDAEQSSKGSVCSLSLAADAIEVLKSLNYHREKLRRGASMLLWLQDVASLRALRTVAPDAFSFRDVVVVIEGQLEISVTPAKEDAAKVRLLRLHYETASSQLELARTAIPLARMLFFYGSRKEARAILLDASAQLPTDTSISDVRTLQANLCLLLAWLDEADGALIKAWRQIEQGSKLLKGATSGDEQLWRLRLLMWKRSPLGLAQGTAGIVRHQLDDTKPPLLLRNNILRDLAWSALTRGEFRHTTDILIELEDNDESAHNKAWSAILRGDMNREAGRLERAEAYYRQASELRASSKTGTEPAAFRLARWARLTGETVTERHILRDILRSKMLAHADDHPGARARFGAERRLCTLDIREGKIASGLVGLLKLIHAAESSSRDGRVYIACVDFVDAIRKVHEAQRMAVSQLKEASIELEVAQSIAESLPGDAPPWYAILFRGLRAELLVLQQESQPLAIQLAEQALQHARSAWRDAIPLQARIYIEALVRGGRFQDALDELTHAEPEVAEQRHLLMLARLQALGVSATTTIEAAAAATTTATKTAAADTTAVIETAATKTGTTETTAPAVDPLTRLAALRETLDEIGAPRPTADTLLYLARHLPHESTAPDPLELLDEALTLFMDMGIVADEARCLETMGDVLASRGDTGTARRRYLASKAIAERYQLGLRLPLLTQKLEQLN